MQAREVSCKHRLKCLASPGESYNPAMEWKKPQIQVSYIYKNDDSLLSLANILMLSCHNKHLSPLFDHISRFIYMIQCVLNHARTFYPAEYSVSFLHCRTGDIA